MGLSTFRNPVFQRRLVDTVANLTLGRVTLSAGYLYSPPLPYLTPSRSRDEVGAGLTARIGDNWRKRYHALTLHNEVHVNHLPYMPFPPTWPVFIPKDMLANWFEVYAEAMVTGDTRWLDDDEQRYWATIAGRQIRFDQRADFARAKAEELAASMPDAIIPQQFENPANPEILSKTLRDLRGFA